MPSRAKVALLHFLMNLWGGCWWPPSAMVWRWIWTQVISIQKSIIQETARSTPMAVSSLISRRIEDVSTSLTYFRRHNLNLYLEASIIYFFLHSPIDGAGFFHNLWLLVVHLIIFLGNKVHRFPLKARWKRKQTTKNGWLSRSQFLIEVQFS